ncbi:hypothetical protein JCM10207_003044 [Rhodosporidiobolus poonsookiae]
MSSRVMTRPQAPATTTTSSAVRRPQYAAASASGRYAPPSHRRDPPAYTVERVRGQDGVVQEVLTLEDTPEPSAAAAGPVAGPSNGNSYASTSGHRRDAYAGYEPAPKKRKSDVGAGGYAAAPAYAAGYPAQYPAAGTSYQQPYRQPPPAGPSGQKRKADALDNKQGTSAYSEPDGHYRVEIGAIVSNAGTTNSYVIEKLLGQGTFGKVVAAIEKPTKRKVALKIIRAVHKYQEAAKTEIKVLQRLKQSDERGRFKCIRLDSHFDFHGHTCLVTPLLSCSVFDFLKENHYEPFPLSHVHSFAKQLLESLKYVHGQGLIHTDLKPENILLEDNSYTEVQGGKGRTRKILKNTGIQLIDFGSATFEREYHANVVSTRHYRAPEIILNAGWNYPCDLWSIGCILVEFITGEALFQTHENLEHLAMMERVFGPMPAEMAKRAHKALDKNCDWFRRAPNNSRSRTYQYELNFPSAATPKSSKKFVQGMKSLRDIIARTAGTDIAANRFSDLCEGLLQWDVSARLTVDQALDHDFFRLGPILDDGNPQRR